MSKEAVDESSQAPIHLYREKKRSLSEIKSREAEQKYRELFNFVSDGLFQIDLARERLEEMVEERTIKQRVSDD